MDLSAAFALLFAEPLDMSQSKDQTSGNTLGGGPVEFLAENAVLDFGSIGSEARMSDAEARSYWQKIYAALGGSESENVIRQRIFMWVCLNSTSGRAEMTSKILIGGRKVAMSKFVNDFVLPRESFRQFIRAPKNVKEIEQIARHPSAEGWMRTRAKQAGVRSSCYVAVVDVAEYFDLTPDERAEAIRYKAAVLRNTNPNAPPDVNKIFTPDANTLDRRNEAPAPTVFGRGQ